MSNPKDKHYAFFQNRECEYFPCHEGVAEEDFNCLFCYCPLYMLGKECGGNFSYTEKGIKNCKNCNRPHMADHYGEIIGQFLKIKDRMQAPECVHKNQKELRRGFTTGTCSAVAAVAGCYELLMGMEKNDVTIDTPKGIRLDVAVEKVSASETTCEYRVKKDSGDDPDVTNQAYIHVKVEKIGCGDAKELSNVFISEYDNQVFLAGGTGVGRVTKEGLEQKVGMPAINVVPRKMIFQGVHDILDVSDYDGALLITITVPEGETLAKQTFNEQLGIQGGISILGTSGILEPMSEKAIIDTIEVEIRQLSNTGCKNLLVTPGNYGQVYASKYLNLDLSESVKSSNYIGDTIDLAISYGMESFLLVGNIGKLIKLAAGIMNTHSKVADARGEIMAVHTVLCGGTKEMADKIMGCVNTEQMLKLLEEWNLREGVIQSILKKIQEHMQLRIKDKMEFGVILFSESFGYLGQTENAGTLLEKYR